MAKQVSVLHDTCMSDPEVGTRRHRAVPQGASLGDEDAQEVVEPVGLDGAAGAPALGVLHDDQVLLHAPDLHTTGCVLCSTGRQGCEGLTPDAQGGLSSGLMVKEGPAWFCAKGLTGTMPLAKQQPWTFRKTDNCLPA